MKSLADDKMNLTQKMKFALICLRRVENILGKGECIFPFPKMFSKASFFRVVKSREFVVKILPAISPFYTPEGSYHIIPPVVRPSARLSVRQSVRPLAISCPSVSNFLCA